MKTIKVIDSSIVKRVSSEDYNYLFNKTTGYFSRWGKNKEDDPVTAPAPEILDIEISAGPCSQNCTFCYKENGKGPLLNMTFGMFKNIFDKISATKVLTQIAFGITDIYTNPDFFKMMEYCRENGVIPNYTTSGFDLDDEAVKKTRELCGATAVSIHDKNVAFNAIKKLTDSGMTQINIHWVLMEENYEDTFKLIDELKADERTQKLNALVFLAYKPKGRNAGKFNSIKDASKYQKLMEYAKEKGINIGFDSCSCPVVFKASREEDFEYISTVGEPCESTLFSSYINVNGDFFPCSFTEGEPGWETGISVLEADNFNKVWKDPRVKEFREKLIHTSEKCDCKFSKLCRNCPTFTVTTCHN